MRMLLASLQLLWTSQIVVFGFQASAPFNRPFLSQRNNVGKCLATRESTATEPTRTASNSRRPQVTKRKRNIARRSDWWYSLFPYHHVNEAIQTAHRMERDCISSRDDIPSHNKPATRKWISSFLNILTQWARIGDGHEAQRVLEQGWAKLSPPTSDADEKQKWLDVEIKAHRRVLHAWCNQVERCITTERFQQQSASGKKNEGAEQRQCATRAGQTLRTMEELSKKYTALSSIENRTLLSAGDYTAVIRAHTRSGQVESAVRCLQRMEELYVSSEHDAKLAPSVSLYTAVIKSLANCRYKPAEWRSKMGVKESPAQIATHIAQRCAALYQHAAAKSLKPDLQLYNAVLDAWSKELPPPSLQPKYSVWLQSEDSSLHAKVVEGARAVWDAMVRSVDTQPDARSYTLLLYTMCKCGLLDEAYDVWRQLMDRLLPTEGGRAMEKVDTRSFRMLINSSARRISDMGRNITSVGNATVYAERIGHVLDGMWRLHEAGYRNSAPDKYLYTTAISSWADVDAPESVQRAQDWFMDLEFKFQSTGWDSLRPDVTVYNSLVNAFAKQPNVAEAAEKAGSIVKQMERISKTNPNVLPDTITYNTLIDACLASPEASGIERAEQSLLRMLDEYRSGNDRVKPNARSYATIIQAWANSPLAGSTSRAEKLLDLMEERFDPPASLYEDVTLAWCRDAQTATIDAAQRARRLLYRMEQLYDEMDNEAMRPDMSLYTAVIKAYNTFGEDGFEEAENVRRRRDRLYSNEDSVGAVKKKTFKSNAEVFALLNQLDEKDSAPRPLGRTWNFNAVLSLLAKSGKVWAGQRAEDVLDYMLDSFQNKRNDEMQPDEISFNSVMAAWARCSHPEAAIKAEAVLERLNSLHETGILQDVEADRVSYNTIINAYAKSSVPGSAQEAERVFDKLLELHESTSDVRYRPDIVTYVSLIDAWANSDAPVAARHAEDVLLRMLQDYKAGHTNMKPNTMCFNGVLNAWAKSSDTKASKKAEMLLRLMEDMYIGGKNDDVQPDTQSYNIVLNALANSQDKDAGTKAQLLLERMHEEHRNGNTAIRPDIITYNTVLNAVANHGGKESLDEIGRLLEEAYDNDDLELSVAFFSSLIYSLSRTGAKGAVWLAEQILAVLKQMNKNGVVDVKPDTAVYNALLNCWSNSGERTSAVRAEDILNYMEAEYQRGNTNVIPDVQTYTSVIDVIAKSRVPDVKRAEEIFERMQERYRTGDSSVRPNVHTYTALIQTYARSDLPLKAVRAQSILKRMKTDYQDGNASAQPTAVAYNAVLNACEYSFGDDDTVQKAFKVACVTFDEMRSSKHLRPNHITYGTFMGVCGKLMPKSDVRTDMLELVFRRCCAEGQVGPVVLKKLREAASPSMYNRLVDGVSENELPIKWTVNVKER